MKTTNSLEVRKMVKNHILEYYTLEELKEQVVYIINPSVKDARTWETLTYGERHCISKALKTMVYGGCFLIYNHEIADFLESLKLTNQKNTVKPLSYYLDMNDLLEYYSSIIVAQCKKMLEEDK